MNSLKVAGHVAHLMEADQADGDESGPGSRPTGLPPKPRKKHPQNSSRPSKDVSAIQPHELSRLDLCESCHVKVRKYSIMKATNPRP